MDRIEIRIAGSRTGIGKTTVAQMIDRFLTQHGINADFVSADGDCGRTLKQTMRDSLKDQIHSGTLQIAIVDDNSVI